LGLPDPPAGGAVRGKAVHSLVEYAMRAKIAGVVLLFPSRAALMISAMLSRVEKLPERQSGLLRLFGLPPFARPVNSPFIRRTRRDSPPKSLNVSFPQLLLLGSPFALRRLKSQDASRLSVSNVEYFDRQQFPRLPLYANQASGF
jgi:hypothetical protein